MFSPEPSLRTRFLIARGETVAGQTVDLLREGPAGDIERASGRYDRMRWRQYFAYTLSGEARRDVRARLAAYLAQRWDSLHSGGQRLTTVDLSHVHEAIRTPHGDAHPADRDRRVRGIPGPRPAFACTNSFSASRFRLNALSNPDASSKRAFPLRRRALSGLQTISGASIAPHGRSVTMSPCRISFSSQAT